MRCSCHVCDTYMNQSEGLELGCVCPNCGYRCKACLGTNSVVGRESLKDLKDNALLMQDILNSFDEAGAADDPLDDPAKWGDEQWED